MTDIELHRHNQLPEQRTERPLRLVEWADEARAANLLAESLCRTPFAGQFRDDPMGGTAAILRGAEMGLTPVTALGAFDLIQGTVAPKAITLRALVQSQGHMVWIESSSATECVAKGRRHGESVVQESRWTIRRAQQLNLTNKSNWKNQPEAMLVARATAEVCRMIAADVILGIGYSSEEVSDSEPAPTISVTRTRSTTPTKAQRKPRPAPAPAAEPDLEPPAADPKPATEGPELRTEAQSRKLWALARERGLDADGFKDYVRQELGRDLGSTKEITKAEAGALIDQLEALDPATGEVHDVVVIGGPNSTGGEQ